MKITKSTLLKNFNIPKKKKSFMQINKKRYQILISSNNIYTSS